MGNIEYSKYDPEYTVEKEYPFWHEVRFGDMLVINNGSFPGSPGYEEKHDLVHERGEELIFQGESLQSYSVEGWDLMKIIRQSSVIEEEDYSNDFR